MTNLLILSGMCSHYAVWNLKRKKKVQVGNNILKVSLPKIEECTMLKRRMYNVIVKWLYV